MTGGSAGHPVVSIRVGDDYEVIVGRHATDRLPELLYGARKVAVVSSKPLRQIADSVRDEISAAGFEAEEIEIPAGEKAKDLVVAQFCWQTLGELGLDRQDVIVSVGGGATTDLAGFVAATWMRGIRVVHIPTTVLAMVDAAIGGKTAINTEAGKNMVGAFHNPAGVLVDPRYLAGLPEDDFSAGMVEVAKAGFIADPVIVDLLEADPVGSRHARGDQIPELIERAIRVKAAVVAGDLRERGTRLFLNYGHTLGHAIEKVEHYGWRHGDAVGVGMIYAAILAGMVTGLDYPTVVRHRAVIAGLRRPVRYRPEAFTSLRRAMGSDKKTRAGDLRFVLLKSLANPAVITAPAEDTLAAAYEELCAQ